MSSVLYALASPILLFISIPLVLFAAITTSLAFSTLFFRALIVYLELAAALIQNQLAHQITSPKNSSPVRSATHVADEKTACRKSRRGSTGSGSSNGGSVTPKVPESSGFGIYSGGGAARDFEGVGGWRIPGSDDEDEFWTPMNTRLELPAIGEGRRRNHRRSKTSGSLTTLPLPAKSSGIWRARTPIHTHNIGFTSPQEYFISGAQSKSTTDLDAAHFGKASNSSSGSSQSSIRTLQLTQTNTGIFELLSHHNL